MRILWKGMSSTFQLKHLSGIVNCSVTEIQWDTHKNECLWMLSCYLNIHSVTHKYKCCSVTVRILTGYYCTPVYALYVHTKDSSIPCETAKHKTLLLLGLNCSSFTVNYRWTSPFLMPGRYCNPMDYGVFWTQIWFFVSLCDCAQQGIHWNV